MNSSIKIKIFLKINHESLDFVIKKIPDIDYYYRVSLENAAQTN